jgi:hypothetical protein
VLINKLKWTTERTSYKPYVCVCVCVCRYAVNYSMLFIVSGRIEASSNGLSSSTTALIVGTSSMRTTQ